jgi:predicted methyltransferase MtxX (methanogen marker protein 4)
VKRGVQGKNRDLVPHRSDLELVRVLVSYLDGRVDERVKVWYSKILPPALPCRDLLEPRCYCRPAGVGHHSEERSFFVHPFGIHEDARAVDDAVHVVEVARVDSEFVRVNSVAHIDAARAF